MPLSNHSAQKASGLTNDDPLLSQIVEDLQKKGIAPHLIGGRLEKALLDGTPKVGARLLKALKRAMPAMLAERRALEAEFRQRLHKTWGRGFDLLRALLEAAREAGEEFNNQRRPAAAAAQDLVFDALVRLHARACLVTGEILWLMEGGYASGAQARWRTLHEIAVVSFFITGKGQDVAERYLLHDAIDSYKAAVQYQQHCRALGHRLFTKRQLERMKSARDELCQRFERDYGGDWGWGGLTP